MRIVNLSKSYEDHKVLEHLNLTLEDGGIYAVMGASGRGKTTLFHILLGLIQADEGRVEGLEGKRLSVVFQEDRLIPFLTAGENVAVVQEKPMPLTEIHQVLEEILPRESLGQAVREYSGGMKRRAAIGRAILQESQVLIMDEPLAGLDEETKAAVITFILKYRGSRTLLFSTHQEEDVELFCANKILLP